MQSEPWKLLRQDLDGLLISEVMVNIFDGKNIIVEFGWTYEPK